MDERTVTFYRRDDMPKEKVSDVLDRRLITCDRMMLTHVYLKKGAIVPRHSHENEQITYVLDGGLRFWIGQDEWKCFCDLPRRPFRRRMRSHIEVNCASSMVAHHYEHKQQTEANRRHHQEICCNQLLDVVLNKSAPRL